MAFYFYCGNSPVLSSEIILTYFYFGKHYQGFLNLNVFVRFKNVAFIPGLGTKKQQALKKNQQRQQKAAAG